MSSSWRHSLGGTPQSRIRPFAIEVRDETMRGAGLRDGDTAWINPQRQPREHDVVLARIEAPNGRASLKLCLLGLAPSRAAYLATLPARRPRRLPHTRFEIIGPGNQRNLPSQLAAVSRGAAATRDCSSSARLSRG